MLLDLRSQVVEVDVALLVAADDHDAHAGHDRRGGVGAVGAAGDQADVALACPVARWCARMASSPASSPWLPAFGCRETASYPVISTSQSSSWRIELTGADGVFDRSERMQTRQLRPGDRLHLRGGVELHRAGAQRDHRPVQRQVLVGQRAQPAQHRRLAVVGVEDRVRQVDALAQQPGSSSASPVVASRASMSPVTPKAAHTAATCSRLVVSSVDDAHGVRIDQAEVDPAFREQRPRRLRRVQGRGPARCRRTRARQETVAAAAQALGEQVRQSMGALVRSSEAPQARDRRRTPRPSPPAGPGRCRCWRWPSPGGCAARGSAARGDRRGRRQHRRSPPRDVPAGCARGQLVRT